VVTRFTLAREAGRNWSWS